METTRFSHSARWFWVHFCPQAKNHFPRNTALFRMIYYKLIVEDVHREPTENVAVVKQGLLLHIIFHGRAFKGTFY